MKLEIPCPTCDQPLRVRTEWNADGMVAYLSCERWWCRVQAWLRAVLP